MPFMEEHTKSLFYNNNILYTKRVFYNIIDSNFIIHIYNTYL